MIVDDPWLQPFEETAFESDDCGRISPPLRGPLLSLPPAPACLCRDPLPSRSPEWVGLSSSGLILPQSSLSNAVSSKALHGRKHERLNPRGPLERFPQHAHRHRGMIVDDPPVLPNGSDFLHPD
jgi:hypothetical protein